MTAECWTLPCKGYQCSFIHCDNGEKEERDKGTERIRKKEDKGGG
jgi:hypothetical protein